MNDTSLHPWRPLRDLRVWAGVFAFWFAFLWALHAAGAMRIEVEGVRQSLTSSRVLEQVLRGCSAYAVGTMIALHCAPRLAGSSARRFWLLGALLVVTLAAVHGVVSGFAPLEPQVIALTTLMSLFPYAAIVGTAVVLQQRERAAAQRSELQAAQLRALRAQLQPHFLFNTLHAIGAVAPRDGATAARMTTLLGDLLRQTLRDRGNGLVSLAEEQELLHPYLALQQLRFADRLRVELDVPPEALGAAVPDLVLQPLVENALQHGIEARPGAGRVRITGRRDGATLVVQVHDDGVGLAGGQLAPGTGLGATRARLQALYGDAASLTLASNANGGTTATLRLPWREVARAA